ncbi:hypothetical protein Q7P37_008553 [Cladosporium fusiforme]
MWLTTLFVALGIALTRHADGFPHRRNPVSVVQKTQHDALVFQMGNVSYLADTKNFKVKIGLNGLGQSKKLHQTGKDHFPITVLSTNESTITDATISAVLNSYKEIDDVFAEDFLQGIILTSAVAGAKLDFSAEQYLNNLDLDLLIIASQIFSAKTGRNSAQNDETLTQLAPGPYLASIRNDESLLVSAVYRLYLDNHRDFLYGAYVDEETGVYTALDVTYPAFRYGAIPVPSRLYSVNDPRPLAGYRVAIKDLFDMKGLVTTGGSHALAHIRSAADETAPSIKRIVELGGVLVGKYKLAQFASGANPWDWGDEHYPWNPRGDGWLTCSASSSGGGCGIAAYDWLDFAIGTDTGSSMRRPAAVSGTYGNRPSQGLMNLEGVIPLGGASDTAGVFSRDPKKWARFAKHWYTPTLHQDTNTTGLSELIVPQSDQSTFPKTLLYPTDYLPLNNTAAQPILDAFIGNMTSFFGMQVKRFNFTATVQNASDPVVANLTARNVDVLNIIDYHPQWEEIGQPLIAAWAKKFDGRFPPIDKAYRDPWSTWNTTTGSTLEDYAQAVHRKRRSVDWYEENLQFSTAEACSESVMLYDIGTGGLPSYREEGLNDFDDASFLAVTPKGTVTAGANLCPLFGCADFTVPIGQVPYQSRITFHEEMVPVTINMVVKRGCDFVLYDMIEKLAEAGVLQTVRTGAAAF